MINCFSFLGTSVYCAKSLSTLSIIELVKERNNLQTIEIAFFINVEFSEYRFWILYAFTVFGMVLVTIAESSDAFLYGYKYFTCATNLLDIGNLFCAGICLVCTLTRYKKDTALWFGSTSVLLSWIINAKAVGDMPIVGNWVYLFGNTVKKVVTLLLVFMPLLFGFGLRFKFMFPTKVYTMDRQRYYSKKTLGKTPQTPQGVLQRCLSL
jgi:hypothetical protein